MAANTHRDETVLTETDTHQEAEALWKCIDKTSDGPVRWTEDGEDVILDKQTFKTQCGHEYKGILDETYLCMKMFILLLKKFNFSVVNQSKNMMQFTSPYFKRDFKELIYVLPIDLNWGKRGHSKRKTKKQLAKQGPSEQDASQRKAKSLVQIDPEQQVETLQINDVVLNHHIEGDYQREPLDLRLRQNDCPQKDAVICGDSFDTSEPVCNIHVQSQEQRSCDKEQKGTFINDRESGFKTYRRISKRCDKNVGEFGETNFSQILEECAESISVKENVCICPDISSVDKTSETGRPLRPEQMLAPSCYSTKDSLVEDCVQQGSKSKHLAGCNAWRNILDTCSIVLMPYVKTPLGMYPLGYIKNLCKEHPQFQEDTRCISTTAERYHGALHNDHGNTSHTAEKCNSSSRITSSHGHRNGRNRGNNQPLLQDNTSHLNSASESGGIIRSSLKRETSKRSSLPPKSDSLGLITNKEDNQGSNCTSIRRSGSLTDLSRFMGKVTDILNI